MMHRRSAILAVVAVLFTAAGAYFLIFRTPDSSPPPAEMIGLLPPDAPLALYANVHGLRESPLLPRLLPLFSTEASDPDYAQFVQRTGFDYTRDLDRIALAWFPAVSSPAASGPVLPSRLLLVGDGRFRREKIKEALSHEGATLLSGKTPVYQLPSKRPGSLLRIVLVPDSGDTQRIVIADGILLDSILGPSRPSSSDPLMPERLQRVSGAPIFVIGRPTLLPASIEIGGLRSEPLERLLHSLHAFTFAARPEKDSLRLSLEGECRSREDAMQLSGALEAFRLIASAALNEPRTRARMSPDALSLLDRFVKNADVMRQDTRVVIRFELPVDVMLRLLGSVSPEFAPKN